MMNVELFELTVKEFSLSLSLCFFLALHAAALSGHASCVQLLLQVITVLTVNFEL